MIFHTDISQGPADPQPTKTSKNNSKRCYFGNIPFATSEEEVKSLFQSCGEVKDLYIVKDKLTKESQGYGFVEFTDASAKDKALELNGNATLGRPMKVNNVTARKGDPRTRLFVKEIPPEQTEESVKALFTQFGTVTNVFFIKDKVTKISRGFGFVEFEDADTAQKALQLNGYDGFGPKPLIVKQAHPQEQKPIAVAPFHQPQMTMFQQTFSPYGNPYSFGAPMYQPNMYETTNTHAWQPYAPRAQNRSFGGSRRF
jgi:RNA recognition motif-containing protein